MTEHKVKKGDKIIFERGLSATDIEYATKRWEMAIPDEENLRSGFILHGDGVWEHFDSLSDYCLIECFKQGRWYATKEEAIAASNWNELNTTVLAFIADKNREHNWVCDFGDNQQDKYSLTYSHKSVNIVPLCSIIFQDFSVNKCMNKQTYEELIKHFAQDELKQWVQGS